MNNASKQRKTTEWERLEVSSKKLEYQGNISYKDGHNKGRKTTRPFRYDLNQIPYDYTVEVRNRA